jgi:hypothetical protein
MIDCYDSIEAPQEYSPGDSLGLQASFSVGPPYITNYR